MIEIVQRDYWCPGPVVFLNMDPRTSIETLCTDHESTFISPQHSHTNLTTFFSKASETALVLSLSSLFTNCSRKREMHTTTRIHTRTPSVETWIRVNSALSPPHTATATHLARTKLLGLSHREFDTTRHQTPDTTPSTSTSTSISQSHPITLTSNSHD